MRNSSGSCHGRRATNNSFRWHRRGLAVPALLLLSVASAPRVRAQAAHLDERLIAAGDSTQSFAQYLPPGYSANRRWPILFVLDPRGRAMLALELFRPAAERLGFVILSSYNSMSDGPPEPNVRAVNAMIASAQGRLSVDARRFYFAGFSGTARAALEFALELRGHVAGILADGAAVGFAPNGVEVTFAGDSTFAYFAATGQADFNHEEVRAAAERMRLSRVPNRLAIFPGPHSWPPEDVCARALDWFQLRAMVSGLAPADSAWMRARLAADLASAERFDRTGQWDEARQLFRAIAQDFAAWPDARDAGARADAIAQRPAFRRYEDERRKVADADERQATDLQRALTWARQQRSPPPLDALEDKLQTRALQQRIARGDSVESESAIRLLARVAVFVSFYEPRTYLAAHDPQRALRMLEVAASIAPLRGESCPLLRDALSAATPDQRQFFAGQCDVAAPASVRRDARAQTRTGTPLRERDFKSLSSTRFATRAVKQRRQRARAPRRSPSLNPRPSTLNPELLRAGNGTRTRDPNLGKVVLYQLSYSRARRNIFSAPGP
jgi:predicted esterase